jgi:5-aminolevulinate synthase
MDAVLRQSKAMCPFLKTASPATLRALSTSARPKAKASPCGGTMSNLQLLAHRCPVMGKAMSVQMSKYGAAAGLRALSSNAGAVNKARIHTSRNQEARAVDSRILSGQETGKGDLSVLSPPSNWHRHH